MDGKKTLASCKVAIYARFSTERQRETSIDDQVYRCRQHIAQAGGDADRAVVFSDYAISGASLDRPGFESLMAAVAEKRIDIIFTEDISRISRDFADSAQVFKRLRYEQVPLISIADGIGTSTRDAKLSFTLKSLVADLYLDDLRDKTMRGLEGRARAGYSTGQTPIGYLAVPERGSRGKILGYRLEIDPEGSALVKRIFEMYRDGHSMGGIGKILGREGILSPRTRRKVWGTSTIKAILANSKYIGIWKYRTIKVVKEPGTNKRIVRKRDEHETMTFERPELRIIEQPLWDAVRGRRKAVRAQFNASGKMGEHSHGRSPYLLSGLLTCGECGAKMTIVTSGPVAYYRCSGQRRQECTNNVGIREEVARVGILARLRAVLMDREGIDYARKRIAEKLATMNRDAGNELPDHRRRLKRIEARIKRLIEHLADGNSSEYVKASLRDLEAQADAEKQTIAALEARAQMPAELPSVDDILAGTFDLDAILRRKVKVAREQLRRMFRNGQIELIRDGDGYIARSKVLPLVPFDDARVAGPNSNDSAMFHGQIASPQWTWNTLILSDFETESLVRRPASA